MKIEWTHCHVINLADEVVQYTAACNDNNENAYATIYSPIFCSVSIYFNRESNN